MVVLNPETGPLGPDANEPDDPRSAELAPGEQAGEQVTVTPETAGSTGGAHTDPSPLDSAQES